MKKIIVWLLTLIILFGSLSFNVMASTGDAVFETKKFDFGNKGVENGYIGVSASDAYSKTKGYGFANVNAAENVSSSGTGVCSDAVRFISNVDRHVFNVDLPTGVYKITVTTGDCKSVTISAEYDNQLYFLTGNNATDSFTIPVTDGQLNIYPTYGVGPEFSLCSLEIEQVSTDVVTKPTIWIYGDSTVCNYYNVPDTNAHGWGQELSGYIDTNKYDVRNLAINGMSAELLVNHESFALSEKYGKKGDILILSMGIFDYRSDEANGKDSSSYVNAMTSMVKRAKAKGMTVYLVKQQGLLSDCNIYPVINKKWYGDELDQIAASEGVGIIDLFHPWLQFSLEKTNDIMPIYYQSYDDGRHNEIHPNKTGSEILANMVANQLFPSGGSGDTGDKEEPVKGFDTPSTIIYETEVSADPIKNPHKGFVMEITQPYQFNPDYTQDGKVILGSKDNRAWDIVSVCYGVLKWNELNPKFGVYNWKPIDDMLEACEAHGMTYGIRILPYSTGSGSDANLGAAHNFVPQWVFDRGAHMDTVTYKYGDANGNLDTKINVPRWSDEKYIEAYNMFITALAKRYDGDPRVEFVEIRAFGNFGEWHTSQFVGNAMPSIQQQKDMIAHFVNSFPNTTVCCLSDVKGEVYDYALSIGATKRNDGLIMTPNEEWDLLPTYRANLPVLGDYHHQYNYMKNIEPDNRGGFLPWTVTRFRETIEIPHLTMLSLDMDSTFGYLIYKEQKPLIDEMTHRLGYNYTVTSAKRDGNRLLVKVKNTGLAPSYFDIQLCAEITDAEGTRISGFGNPVLIQSGTFKDGSEKTYIFEYDGALVGDETICLSMYDVNNSMVAGKDPTVRFDNKNTLSNNRLLLVKISGGEETPPPSEGVLGFCERLYTCALGRNSDPTGVNSWAKAIMDGADGATVAHGFFFSPEFTGANHSNTEYVTRLYKTFMNRDPDAAGLQAWVDALESGASREQVFNGFVNSQEWANICFKYGIKSGGSASPSIRLEPSAEILAFAERLYTTCLGRSADPSGLKAWADALANREGSGAKVAYGFFFSEEFVGKSLDNGEFVRRCYLTFMDREPDKAGYDAWVDALDQGASREQVFNGFVKSPEFVGICEKAGIIAY